MYTKSFCAKLTTYQLHTPLIFRRKVIKPHNYIYMAGHQPETGVWMTKTFFKAWFHMNKLDQPEFKNLLINAGELNSGSTQFWLIKGLEVDLSAVELEDLYYSNQNQLRNIIRFVPLSIVMELVERMDSGSITQPMRKLLASL